MKQKSFKISLLAVAIGGLCSVPSHAADFYFGAGKDIAVQVNSNISIGSSFRTEGVDSSLIGEANGGSVVGSAGTSDDGNLNYGNGDAFSTIIKGSHDIQVTAGNFGGFTRFKYWHDAELEDGNRSHGNAGVYGTNEPLIDDGFSDNAKFTGATLLDAYVYGAFEVAEMPLDVRLGRQVISWGESTFIQGGMNSSNPFDVSALRRPGATLKEGILPVGMAFGSMGITENLSVEAFYQYEWAKTEIDGCGTLFAADFAADGCNFVTALASDSNAMAAGTYVERSADVEAKDGGQFGISARYYSEALNDTEFGFYFMNIHSRTPLINAIRNSNPGAGPLPATVAGIPAAQPFIPSSTPGVGALSVYNPSYEIVFPEDQQYLGLSFATNVAGLALSGELSYRPDTPVQINGGHVLNGALSEDAVNVSPFAARVVAAEPGASVQGYDEFDVTQIQVTAVKFVDRVLGASRLTLIGEVGMIMTDGVEDSEMVYGRDPLFGMTPIIAGGNSASDGGFVTDTAWGYRAQATLNYSDVFAGVSLTPVLAWSHDVDGYSGQQFSEDSTSLGFSVEASYQQTYTASLAYKMFDGGDYNASADKDFVSISLGFAY